MRTIIIEEVRASLVAEPGPVPAIEARTSAVQGQPSEPATDGLLETDTDHQDAEPAPQEATRVKILPQSPPQDTPAATHGNRPQNDGTSRKQKELKPEKASEATLTGASEERLEAAYKALVAMSEEGKPVSGRALARRARVNRDTARAWLKARVTNDEAIVQGHSAHEANIATRPLQEPEPASEAEATISGPEGEAGDLGHESSRFSREIEATPSEPEHEAITGEETIAPEGEDEATDEAIDAQAVIVVTHEEPEPLSDAKLEGI